MQKAAENQQAINYSLKTAHTYIMQRFEKDEEMVH